MVGTDNPCAECFLLANSFDLVEVILTVFCHRLFLSCFRVLVEFFLVAWECWALVTVFENDQVSAPRLNVFYDSVRVSR